MSGYTAKQLLDFPGLALPTISAREVSSSPEAPSALQNEIVEAPFLIFRLGASLFALPALAVREIHALPALSPLPETAPFIVGVLNLRGAIVPVMDLAARLEQDAPPFQLSDTVVVLDFDGADIALIVSEVRSVERLLSTQIEATPAHSRQPGLAAPFVAGVTQVDEGMVMLLHLRHLLDWATPTSASPTGTAVRRFNSQEWTPGERAMLEARAERLRAVATNEETKGDAPVALVALGGEFMGIELSDVREFVSVSALAPVPCCPPHILGQINLRGDIVTLVDVRSTLRTARSTPPYFAGRGPHAVPVVVVQHEGAPVGIAIDQVRDVLYLRDDERLVLDAGTGRGAHNGKFFSGGALYQGRLLPLLDVAQLFAEGDLEVDEGA